MYVRTYIHTYIHAYMHIYIHSVDPLVCQRENGMWNNKEWNMLGKTGGPPPPDCIKCHTFLNSKHLDSAWVVDAAYFHRGWVTNCLYFSIHSFYTQQCFRKVQVYRFDGEIFIWLSLVFWHKMLEGVWEALDASCEKVNSLSTFW
jgi:hypothetical protein